MRRANEVALRSVSCVSCVLCSRTACDYDMCAFPCSQFLCLLGCCNAMQCCACSEDMQSLLRSWDPYMRVATRIFIGWAKTNNNWMFGGDSALKKGAATTCFSVSCRVLALTITPPSSPPPR